jgi:hypothetical protein
MGDGMISFLVCEPYRLIYRPLPKCASTTLFTLFADLGGNRTSSQQRDNLPVVHGVGSPGRGGSYVVKCRDAAVRDLMRRYDGYTWFSVVRDPYSRVVSNYFNKLNRYARRFEPRVYLRGYLDQVLAGPAAWKNVESRLRRIQSRIPFERFVQGLRRYGVGWDIHVDLQTRYLRVDEIRYHHLVKMEHLTDGLRAVLVLAGHRDSSDAAIDRLGWLNRSSAAEASDTWTPATRAIVAATYRRDFDLLGYAA